MDGSLAEKPGYRPPGRNREPNCQHAEWRGTIFLLLLGGISSIQCESFLSEAMPTSAATFGTSAAVTTSEPPTTPNTINAIVVIRMMLSRTFSPCDPAQAASDAPKADPPARSRASDPEKLLSVIFRCPKTAFPSPEHKCRAVGDEVTRHQATFRFIAHRRLLPKALEQAGSPNHRAAEAASVAENCHVHCRYITAASQSPEANASRMLLTSAGTPMELRLRRARREGRCRALPQ